MLVELKIHASAALSTESDKAMLLLKEKNGERMLPILMSMRRASMLTLRHQFSFPLPVPMSLADVSWQMLRTFDIRLKFVELTAIKDGNFVCRIVGERAGEERSLELCLAPDGLVMAVSAHCPIMIEEELLEAQYMHNVGDGSYALSISTLSRQMLKEALQHAVANERYEMASQLRDELAKRNLEENE